VRALVDCHKREIEEKGEEEEREGERKREKENQGSQGGVSSGPFPLSR
jgi:hypothetical protein